jgi:hypothetical protein
MQLYCHLCHLLICTIRSEDNWKFFSPKSDLPYPSQQNHPSYVFEVDRVEELWSTKKLQFGERFCQNKTNFFSPVRHLTRPRTRLWTHLANRFPIPVVRVAASVFGQHCPPHGQNRGGVRRGRPAAGAPDHGDGREVAESGEGSEGDRFPSSPWGQGRHVGVCPRRRLFATRSPMAGTVGVEARALPADAGERWWPQSGAAAGEVGVPQVRVVASTGDGGAWLPAPPPVSSPAWLR